MAEEKGLKKLRAKSGTRTKCENCKCERYSPCGCTPPQGGKRGRK